MDQYTYTYDDAHNMLTKYEVINGTTKGTTSYTYDTLNRLLTVTEPGGRVTTYTYDDAGNRETETIVVGADTTVKTYTYNEQNRLESVEEELNEETQNLYEYDYDDNGNQLTTTRTPYDNGIPQTPVIEITNSYDDFNQLTQTIKDSITSTYGYNGEGLRVEKNIDNTITRYLYEYSNIILETDGDGDETARNVYGINLLVREVDGDSYYYFYNGHADVTALINTDTDAIDASYYYDAFGNILESTGSVSNNIKYAGYQYDEETGYYYLNARMYDPITARFLQEDTYTGDPNDPLSLNLYTYGRNNPLIYIDPTGHFYYIGDEQLSSDLPEEERKKKEAKVIVDKYWESDEANKDFNKDFDMLLYETLVLDSVPVNNIPTTKVNALNVLSGSSDLETVYDIIVPTEYNTLDEKSKLRIEQVLYNRGKEFDMATLDPAQLVLLRLDLENMSYDIKGLNQMCRDPRIQKSVSVLMWQAGVMIGDYAAGNYSTGTSTGPANQKLFTQFQNEDKLTNHFTKHGAEMGYTTSEAYLQGAQNLINSPVGGDIDGFTSSAGTVFRYNIATNEFAIGSEYGTISTYYLPTNGIDYWIEQIYTYYPQ